MTDTDADRDASIATTPESGMDEPGSRTVTLSHEACAVIAGVMAPSDEVRAEGIRSDAFDEIGAAFPVADFWAWAKDAPGRYDPEFGW